MDTRNWWILTAVVIAAATGILIRAEVDTGPRAEGSAPVANQPTIAARTTTPRQDGWVVTRVIDGDTIAVTRGPLTLTVRLIGIDTPETVHPTVPIECYGPEASAFALKALLDNRVSLEFDKTQGRRDYYGRTLAYVWVDKQREPYLFNKRAVRAGLATEYTYDTAYRWRAQFRRAEQLAREQERGLWGACT